MGPENLDSEAAESERVSLASYSVVAHLGKYLPKAYRGFIFAKWLRSLRHGNDFFKLIHPPEAYYDAYQRHIELLLSRPDSLVFLAVLSDDHDVVLGFSLCRGKALDYLYVQPEFRRLGIGTKLIPKGIETITHVTTTGLTIWGNKYSNWKFNPFL